MSQGAAATISCIRRPPRGRPRRGRVGLLAAVWLEHKKEGAIVSTWCGAAGPSCLLAGGCYTTTYYVLIVQL
jgi:hypothetical protein